MKPVQNDHSEIDKAKISMTNGNLMKVFQHSAILLTCIKR